MQINDKDMNQNNHCPKLITLIGYYKAHNMYYYITCYSPVFLLRSQLLMQSCLRRKTLLNSTIVKLQQLYACGASKLYITTNYPNIKILIAQLEP